MYFLTWQNFHNTYIYLKKILDKTVQFPHFPVLINLFIIFGRFSFFSQ